MSEPQKTELKPFHESIVDLIRNLKVDSPGDWPRLNQLAEIIKSTKIPKNHDEIIAAWQEQVQRLKVNWDFGVVISIGKQKDAAEEAARQKAAQQV